MIRVIDTNVPLVVKFQGDNSRELVEACEDILIEILQNRLPVPADSGGEILAEYFHQMNWSGAPTLADEFAKYVNDSRWSWDASARPDIGADDAVEYRYAALAGDDEDIDPSDRKFVAVAKVTGAPIVQGRDTKWLDWSAVLSRHGVEVHWAHEPSIRAMYRVKFGYDAP